MILYAQFDVFIVQGEMVTKTRNVMFMEKYSLLDHKLDCCQVTIIVSMVNKCMSVFLTVETILGRKRRLILKQLFRFF